MDIHTPSVPKHLRISQDMWADLICDPVMAAWIFFGFKFDHFQAARLRYMWWVNTVEEHSGVTSGKTVTDWTFANLRAILLPEQDVSVYYPSFETGKQTFWIYFERCKTKLYRSQFGGLDEMEDTSVGAHKGAGCYVAKFLNGNRIRMPAPSFAKDASTQASLRCNTLIVEEWTVIDAASKGIDKQLTRSVSKPCWNQYHPIWGNHIVFSAHAEDTMHPSIKRHRSLERSVNRGDPLVHTMGYCYKDYSNDICHSGRSYKDEFRIETMVTTTREKVSETEWLGQGLGVWSTGGKGWFEPASLLAAQARGKEMGLVPCMSRREYEEFLTHRMDAAVKETMLNAEG